jgi:hypothetical protein
MSMELPDTMQPSSNRRILAWLGTFAAMTIGAAWVNHRKARR